MREILFRGKRVDNGEWVEGNLIQLKHSQHLKDSPSKEETLIVTDDELVCGYDWIDCFCQHVDSTTIGQFTGLCDKNGKKIFEGDIVNLVVQAGYNHKLYEVFYDVETAQWLMKNGEEVGDCEQFYGQHSRVNLEVIGNIYDNPKLLEGL